MKNKRIQRALEVMVKALDEARAINDIESEEWMDAVSRSEKAAEKVLRLYGGEDFTGFNSQESHLAEKLLKDYGLNSDYAWNLNDGSWC